MGYDAAGRLTSEDHVAEQARLRLRRRARPLRHGHAHAGRRLRPAGHRATPTTGIMPASLEFTGAAAGKYEYTIGDRILPTSEKLTVGATSITRALEFDDDRLATKTGPFTIERTGPARRGLEDHRRQARAELRLRRQRPPGDAHAERGRHRALLPEAHVRQHAAARRSARSASTARADTLAYGYDGCGPAADGQARRDRARGQHLRRQRQPARRRRGLRRPRPADHPRRRRLHVGRRRVPEDPRRRHVRLQPRRRAADRPRPAARRPPTPTTPSGGVRRRARRSTSTATRRTCSR